MIKEIAISAKTADYTYGDEKDKWKDCVALFDLSRLSQNIITISTAIKSDRRRNKTRISSKDLLELAELIKWRKNISKKENVLLDNIGEPKIKMIEVPGEDKCKIQN